MERFLIDVLPRTKFGPMARNGGTIVLIALTELFRQAIGSPLQGFPFLLFFPVIFLIALLFEHHAGLLAAVLSTALVSWFWARPYGSIWVDDPHKALGISLFLLVGAGIAYFTEVLRRSLLRLSDAACETDLLLKEINHRIRNDLQAVSAILSIGRAPGRDPAKAVQQALDRIDITGRIYARIKSDRMVAVVDARELICGLVADLRLSAIGLRPIAIRARSEGMDVSARCAMALGIVVNEGVTNALKYAFPDDRPGVIGVSFRRDGEHCVLVIKDNGVGPTPGAPPQGTGMGSRLITQMALQLDGEVEIGPGDPGGMRITLRLPVESC